MNSFLASAFTVALLHFVWQGAILTAVAAVALRLLGTRSAKARYAVACAVMVAMPLLVGITTAWQLRSGPATSQRAVFTNTSDTQSGQGSPLTAESTKPTSPGADPSQPRPGVIVPSQMLAAWVLPLWLLGVAILCGYRAASWLAAQRLRSRAVCAAVPEWQQRLDRLVQQLRMSRPVVMLESSLTDTPLTMGVLRPVILLPIGLISGLPVEQLELVLLHELAHIRRHDYLINLMQTAVESLLFYHPGVWWLSKRIRMEREYCCDDIVVAATDNATAYARALTELEHRRVVLNDAVLAATGGNLMFRIQRLLGRPAAPKGAMSGPLAVVLLLASCAALFGWQSNPVAPTQPKSAVVSSATQAPKVVAANETTDTSGAANQPNTAAAGVESHSFFRALHEHFWHAILWFHQLIGLGPPKHGVAQTPPPDVKQTASTVAPPVAAPIKAVTKSTAPQPATPQGIAQMSREIATVDGSWKMKNVSFVGDNQQSEFSRVERTFQVAQDPSLAAHERQPADSTESPYTSWLQTDVCWIVTNEEYSAFKALQTDAEREAFIEQFWLHRDPTPGTPENEFKEEHYRRVAYANDHFSSYKPYGIGTAQKLPGWKSDRGMVYIRLGEPDGISGKGVHGPGFNSQTAIWHYNYIEGLGKDVDLTFYNENNAGFRLIPDGQDNLQAGATLYEKMGIGGYPLLRALQPK